MNIILTGLRGSGKSKIGKMIAEILEKKFIDQDQEIIAKEKMSIPEIVAKNGWEYFRKIEKEVTARISKKNETIIATGGGVILDPDNIKSLKSNGTIIYLNVAPEICAKRIENSKSRPPLTNINNVYKEMKKLFEERDPLYKKSADIIFNRTKNPKKDAEELIKLLF